MLRLLREIIPRKGSLERPDSVHGSLGTGGRCARDDTRAALPWRTFKNLALKRQKLQFALSLLVAKGFHGIETGGADRRHHSAYQADDYQDHRGYQNVVGEISKWISAASPFFAIALYKVMLPTTIETR